MTATTNSEGESASASWDFDEWARLAREQPVEFERRRRTLIRHTIAQADTVSRDRLRCLQWRIDMERDRSVDALASCVRIYRMMWSSFAGQRGLVSALQTACGDATMSSAPSWSQARVLSFESTRGKAQRRPLTGS